MKYKKIIFIIISLFFIIGLVLNIPIKNSQAITKDLNYTFENSIIIDDYAPYNNETFNLRNQTVYTQNYTATYDFLNENSGIFIPNEWFNSSTSGYIEISNDYDNHNKVVKMNGKDTGQIGLYQSLSDIEYGTIEYWMLNTDMTNGRPMIWLYHGANELFRVYLRESLVRAYNGAFQDCGYAIENMWIHIRVDFETTLGGYQGLDQYEFKVFTNGIEYGNFAFINNEVHIDKIEIIGTSAITSYYIDAIGYSLDANYNINQNIIPVLEINPEIQEIDKWLFTYDDYGVLYETYDSNLDGFTDIETTGNHVYANKIGFYTQYEINQNSFYGDIGFEKEFSINDGILNVSINTMATIIADDGYIIYYIYSYDLNISVQLKISEIGANLYKLYYYNGSSYIFLFEYDNETIIDFNNYNIYKDNGICILQIDSNIEFGNYIHETFYFPTLNPNKKGLGKIMIKAHVKDNTRQQLFRFDSIGVYINGTSIVDDFAFLTINSNSGNFYYNSIGLSYLELNATGSFSLSILDDNIEYQPLLSFQTFTENSFFHLFNNSETSYNSDYNPVYLRFAFNDTIEINYIYFDQIRLEQDSNVYFLEFSYQNIDINESYFYVKNNRLYYIHNANQNDTLEYIQASFNIDNEYALNSSINFKSYFLGISKANFIINYISEAYSIFEIPLGYKIYNNILPQQQIINSFVFLITDNDNNDYYGNSEGYFSSITLIYYPDIELTILTLSLIEMLIPLIVMIIPTLAISLIYGKKAIIPMLILMTVICFIGNLIEIEVLFIIILCLGSAIFLQYKIERGK